MDCVHCGSTIKLPDLFRQDDILVCDRCGLRNLVIADGACTKYPSFYFADCNNPKCAICSVSTPSEEDIEAIASDKDETIIYFVKVPISQRRDRHSDVAQAYALVKSVTADTGCIIYAKYHGRWEANPWSTRWFVLHLVEKLRAIP